MLPVQERALARQTEKGLRLRCIWRPSLASSVSHENASAFAFILLRTDAAPQFNISLQIPIRRLEQIEHERSHFKEQMQSVQQELERELESKQRVSQRELQLMQELESKLRVSQRELQLMQDALQQVTFPSLRVLCAHWARDMVALKSRLGGDCMRGLSGALHPFFSFVIPCMSPLQS